MLNSSWGGSSTKRTPCTIMGFAPQVTLAGHAGVFVLRDDESPLLPCYAFTVPALRPSLSRRQRRLLPAVPKSSVPKPLPSKSVPPPRKRSRSPATGHATSPRPEPSAASTPVRHRPATRSATSSPCPAPPAPVLAAPTARKRSKPSAAPVPATPRPHTRSTSSSPCAALAQLRRSPRVAALAAHTH